MMGMSISDVRDLTSLVKTVRGEPLDLQPGARVKVILRQSKDDNSPPTVLWEGEVTRVQAKNKTHYVRRDGATTNHFYLFTRYGGSATGGTFVPHTWQLIPAEEVR